MGPVRVYQQLVMNCDTGFRLFFCNPGRRFPLDYLTRTVSPLVFAPSANRTQCEELEIFQDMTYEEDEVFEIGLSSTASNRIVFLPQRTAVTILDDDSKQLGDRYLYQA